MQFLSSLNGLSAEELDQALMEESLTRIQDFREMQQLYNGAIREISTKLEILDEEFRTRYDHNPIHHIESRLKSFRSIMEKLGRKGVPICLESARESLYDIAGVRVICNYIDDIYRLADMLFAQDDVELVRRTDYIASPKANGYRSLHLVVKVPVFLSVGRASVPVEIQIRTIAMDFWASLEHQLRYKATCEVPDALRDQLKACAEQSAELDLQMQDIYRQLSTKRE